MARAKISATAETAGQQTRRRLEYAAASVFARRGFHETKVSDIVSEAGVSQPTFYVYFANKDVAYAALVDRFRERLKALTSSLLITAPPPSEDFVDRLAFSFHSFLEFFAEDRDLTEIGYFQSPGSAETRNALAGWVADNMMKEQESAVFRSDIPPDLMGRCLIGIVDQMARLPTDAAQRREIAYACSLLFCRGVQLRSA